MLKVFKISFYLAVVGVMLATGGGRAQDRRPANANPIASINGVLIYESDLATTLGQLYQLRKQAYEAEKTALESAIEQRLLSAEATRQGLSVAELLAREVDSKVAEPTDGEIQAFYLAQPDRRQHPFLDAKAAMRAALRRARAEQLRQEYLKTLREEARVEVFLDAPRFQVSYDAARMKGGTDAPVRIVEFSDFECPYCRAAERTVQSVIAKYGDRVALAYRDFPLNDIHKRAQLAAEASRCAGEQGKYWEYHDRLLSNSGLEVKDLKANANAIGLDSGKFDACLDERKERTAVEHDAQEGRMAGVSGTPAFFINGIPLLGAQPASEFEKIIEEELARRRSGAQVSHGQ